jgi:NAD(P)-dependent dehydrogenase (short-subunit alcohol dehydrogenase family)
VSPGSGEHGVLDGRVAVVTGAVGNLGPVWVDALVGAGAFVYAFVLPGTGSEERAELEHPGRAVVVDADVTDRASLERASARVLDDRGAPHVLVNNAGIDQPPFAGQGVAIRDIDPDGFLRVLQVNTLGAFQVSQLLGSAMVDARRGSIVNIGSLYASVSPDARMYDHLEMDPPFVKPPAYGASKAGLVNLTKFLSTHWGPFGVRVNALSPGGVAGGQDQRFVEKFSARVPLGRLARPDELVGPLLFLASDASSYVTGIELRVDGGFTAW